jgi:ABC-2 type transport system permease protein
LRGQTRLTRTLNPLEASEQRFWEYLNYGLALAGLLLVWIWRRRVAVRDRRRYQRILGEV